MRYYFAILDNKIIGLGTTKSKARENGRKHFISDYPNLLPTIEYDCRVELHQTDARSWDEYLYSGSEGVLFFNFKGRLLYRDKSHVVLDSEFRNGDLVLVEERKKGQPGIQRAIYL